MGGRLIVIGGGGAGTAAATIAKRLDPGPRGSLFTEFEGIAYSPCGIPFVHRPEDPPLEGPFLATIAKRLDPDLRVSLFTEFEDIAYSPCGIPFVHGREIPRFEDLFLSTVDRYVADGLDMRMETVVTEIDLDRRVITARNQHEGFDQLVICTGFQWEKPDVPGANLEGLHYVKNIRKAMEFDKLLDTVKTVAVIGASPLGVEMAGNLGHRGLDVHFVDEGPWVLSEILD